MRTIAKIATILAVVIAAAFASTSTNSDVIHMNLIHDRVKGDYFLDIPKKWLNRPYKSESYDNVEFVFDLDEAMQPIPISENQTPWDYITVTLERSVLDDYPSNHFKNSSYLKKVDPLEISEPSSEFDVFIYRVVEFPDSSEELRLKNGDESIYISCFRPMKKERSLCRAHTYYKGLMVEYAFHHTKLSQWRELRGLAFQFIARFRAAEGEK